MDIYGYTPFYFACQEGHIFIVKCLVKLVENINKESIGGLTSLHQACYNGYIIVVKYLVEHGANINKKKQYWSNPIILCLS